MEFKVLIDRAIADYFEQLEVSQSMGALALKKSMEYSALNGGKRFRPQLALLVAQAFQKDYLRVLPFACAVEFVHTYSLIHDDLPAMDNDDFRRGEPTNHKVFGEAMALLAGDALLTEAFGLIAGAYRDQPELAVELIALLASASGAQGMVGGQAMDISAQNGEIDLESLNQLHALKTGGLIRVAAEGAARICDLSEPQVNRIRDYGAILGLAFQIADDLLDHQEGKIEISGLPGVLGVHAAREYLTHVTNRGFEILSELELKDTGLGKLLKMNLNREV